MPNKQKLRQQLRLQRISIPKSSRKRASLDIQNNILKIIKKKHLKIAIYENMGSEVSLQPLIKHFDKYYSKISLYKPVYFRFYRRMWFVPIRPKTTSKIRIEALDMVLTPMLGIDYNGHRLGQGGGYYDASFKHILLRTHPQKIAIGFDCQLINCIPYEKHDIRMNTFISEKRILQFKK